MAPDTHMILIEQVRDSGQGAPSWIVEFEGHVETLPSRDEAICHAAGIGAQSWARDHRALEIVLKEGSSVREVGRFVDVN